jgi:hypothetical protein
MVPRPSQRSTTQAPSIAPPSVSPSSPTFIEGSAEGYRSTEQIIFRKEFEKVQDWVDERLSNINNVMGVIILVLALGFITLGFSLWSLVQQSMNSYDQTKLKQLTTDNINTAKQLKQSVDKLNIILKEINKNPSPNPTSQ